MPVARNQIVARGIKQRCPNCGERTLFQPDKPFAINPACPHCGLKLDRGDGFFLGPFIINYSVTIGLFVVPVILLFVFDVIGSKTAIALGGASALLVPLVLYRWSWGWWLACYFYFLPQKLPANRDSAHEAEEE
jgi:uncharacterized protein (DUF983 family)